LSAVSANQNLAPDSLEDVLDYHFQNPQLLIRALTHKSHPAERSGLNPELDNEQLEFFGDAILGFLVSEALLERFPGFSEGRLSKLKSWLVSSAHLHTIAERLQLGDALILGRGEEMSGGRAKRALLSDAVEAILAAIYLDGGMDAARRFARTRILSPDSDWEASLPTAIMDFKSALQERVQALKLPPPKYVTVAERGPEHAKVFEVEVRIGKSHSARGEGVSKKDAGQKAAELLFFQLHPPATANLP
jgi:ribonuclease III